MNEPSDEQHVPFYRHPVSFGAWLLLSFLFAYLLGLWERLLLMLFY